MVACQLPKLNVRVRFPLPAPASPRNRSSYSAATAGRLVAASSRVSKSTASPTPTIGDMSGATSMAPMFAVMGAALAQVHFYVDPPRVGLVNIGEEAGKGRRIAVLGDMLELGTEETALHEGLAALPTLAAADVVHCVGPRMKALWALLRARERSPWDGAVVREIEQRGMALTPKGRSLYDRLLQQVRDQVPDAAANVDEYYRQLQQGFTLFPDDLTGIWQQGLGYFRYRAVSGPSQALRADWQWLIDYAHVRLIPLTYEDFLPVSAAGIFQSNLDQRETQQIVRSPNQQAFEQALGCAVVSEFEFYAQIQSDSISQCLQQLGFERDITHRLMRQLEEITA